MAGSCVAQQVLTTVTDPNGRAPRDVAVNPVTNPIYVINQSSSNVTVIDGATNSVIASVPVGTQPSAIGVNTVTNRIYVASSSGGDIDVIDGATNAVKNIWHSNTDVYVALAVNKTTN